MGYREKVIADGAVAYWRLGETSGTTAVDIIGGANGTISGGVTLGQPGALADGDKAMRFTGGRIEVTNGAFLQFGTGALSVEWWIKSNPIAGWWLDAKADGNSGVPGVGFQSDTSNIYFHPGNGVQMLYCSDGGFGYGDNQWHHIVGVVERGSPDRALFYADGVLRTTVPFSGSGSSLTSASPFALGDMSGGGAPTAGAIDEVAIYKTALTAPQIAAHYAARLYSSATLPNIPRAVVAGMSLRDQMDSYNLIVPVTPSNTVDLADVTDAILVGGAGDVAVVQQNGQVVVLKNVPAGGWLPVAAKRINSSATTATDIVALYQA